jgi:hypothetical protein
MDLFLLLLFKNKLDFMRKEKKRSIEILYFILPLIVYNRLYT